MNTLIRFVWLAPVLALAVAARAASQDAAPASGKILLLANDRVLEGDIDRVGGQYRVRRGIGETLIAVDRAKRLCADWADALAYLRGQANLGDPDERLRLARWCQQNSRKDDALVEARIALEMRPDHVDTKRLLQILERGVAPATSPSPLPVVAKSPAASTQLDLSADAVAMFNTRVQPILLNACASCHANGQGNEFQMLRPGDSSLRAVHQRNLAAAVAQLKLDNPGASPLLVKAVSAHGTMSKAPLRDRRTPAAQMLQQWAEQVALNNPHLLPPGSAAATARSTPAATPQLSTPVVSRTVDRPVGELVPQAAVTLRDALLSQMSPLSNPAAVSMKQPLAPADPHDAYSANPFNERRK